VAGGLAVGTVVATISSVDPDEGETFVYSVVPDDSLDGTNVFEVVDNRLITKATLNRNAKSSYSVRLRTTDEGGLSAERVFTVVVLSPPSSPTNETVVHV
jgi:hypothetical protein